ncbi:MAG: DNA-binding response regulator, partial [Deltaproteobacteria bacterium]
MKKKKTILIIDDHPLLREGLKVVIARDKRYEVIAEAGDGKEGIRLIKKVKPDIVLVDISLPDMNGIDLLHQIRKRFPEIKLMVVSMHSKIDYITESFRAGALGYLAKEAAATSLIKGLDTISRGEYFLDSSISK